MMLRTSAESYVNQVRLVPQWGHEIDGQIPTYHLVFPWLAFGLESVVGRRPNILGAEKDFCRGGGGLLNQR